MATSSSNVSDIANKIVGSGSDSESNDDEFSMHSGATVIVSFDMAFSPLISSTAYLQDD